MTDPGGNTHMERAIIISNGRSGSTLLSDLIVEEPQTCSVQEYFMSLAPWNRRRMLAGESSVRNRRTRSASSSVGGRRRNVRPPRRMTS